MAVVVVVRIVDILVEEEKDQERIWRPGEQIWSEVSWRNNPGENNLLRRQHLVVAEEEEQQHQEEDELDEKQ